MGCRFKRPVRSALLLSLMAVAACAPVQAPPAFEPARVRAVLGEQIPLITLMLWHARDLSLTPEQVGALETRRGEFQRSAEVQTGELQRLELELQGLLSREQVDMAQVEPRVRKIEALRSELRLGRIKTVEKGKAILTPEQWRKFLPLIRGGP
jgi:Spy/CpxP family protein refolding chaperone